jgi:DNA-binding MarR family transcriptional regulator
MDESIRHDSERWLALVRRFCSSLCPVTGKALGEVGITLPQFNAVSLLKEQGELTMTAVAKGLGVTMGAGTSLMDNLVEQGFVERRRSSADRRVVKVALTPKGVDVLARATASLLEFWAAILGPLNPDERARSIETFHEVLNLAERARATLH